MKGIIKALAVFGLLLTTLVAQANNPVYTLEEALKKKLVKAQIQGADSTQPGASNHFGKCLQMQLTNLTADKFTVKLETGCQLLPDDTAVQNMMVTEEVLFVLAPKKHSKKYINAMCIQKSDGSPNNSIKFTMGIKSVGHLLGIAQLVEKHKYFDGAAQAAVWCISDGADIGSIADADPEKTRILQEFVSKATGQKIPVPGELNKNNTRRPERHKITVQFEWSTHREATTTLAVLDANNKPVMEIVKEQLLPAGEHSYTIELNSAEIPLGQYTIILYINRQPKMQRRVVLGP